MQVLLRQWCLPQHLCGDPSWAQGRRHDQLVLQLDQLWGAAGGLLLCSQLRGLPLVGAQAPHSILLLHGKEHFAKQQKPHLVHTGIATRLMLYGPSTP